MSTVTSSGGVLLMVLVIVAMLTVMFISSVGIISRELHVSSDAKQKERVYRVSESGIQYVLFLVGKAGQSITDLLDQNNTTKTVLDPVTSEEIGKYTLAVSSLPLPANGVAISSIAKSEDEQFCSKVSARVEIPADASAGEFFISGWTRASCP